MADIWIVGLYTHFYCAEHRHSLFLNEQSEMYIRYPPLSVCTPEVGYLFKLSIDAKEKESSAWVF